MNFQLQMNGKAKPSVIDIAFGRQFVLPVFFLTMVIVGASVLLKNDMSSSQDTYASQQLVNPVGVHDLRRQIADLEGESERLKAFAKKMVTLAKLDENIFNFDEPPARGGLGGRNIFQRYAVDVTEALSGDAAALKKQLLAQSNQFERMQLVLKSRIMGESERQSRWPVTTAYISSRFGLRKDPFTGRLRKHRGLDLAGPRGSPILSVASGKVIFSGRKGGYGNVVEVRHAKGLVSRYAHLDASLVKKGQQVEGGEKIARLGSTGRSTGPHLHLEILKDNKYIDPLLFLGKQK